ncbi:TetR family transcriptional regulator C-terminal domain-containing protein [Rhizobium sp. 16-488-2a]|nr:TetR family transcriptional regulator C-terminal domain-containing protein [Rhizobium sp. 16-488-2b]MBO9178219.1 TetR family transcriptional regulator C-terminal domain-containing protein [Rhizobium sp. 16-488-2a]
MVTTIRQKLVDAAQERFNALGYSGCGVQEIADYAGVPKSNFYNYFKSKERLALEVLEGYVASSRREILSDPILSPLARIKAHFEFFISRYEKNGFDRGCLIGNLAVESSDNVPLLRTALREALTSWTHLLAEVIEEGQARDEIKPGLDPVEMARFLINSWEGAVLRMKLTRDRRPLDDFMSIAMGLLNERSALST